MITLVSNPAQLITVDTQGKNIKRGKILGSLSPIYEHHLLIENGIIKDFIPFNSTKKISPDKIINVKGKTVIPGLIDCHTHTVFAGSRAEEFKKKINGVSYEDITRAGGGINTTVNAVKNSTFQELINLAKPRINNFISQGVTTLEIKSGYGLDFENEIKLLKVINKLNSIYKIDIIPTFLGAHTIPIDFLGKEDEYLSLLVDKMLPAVRKDNLAAFCDGFCEQTAFSADQIDKIFSKAKQLGFDVRLHTEQFSRIGGIKIALKHNSISIDHLEVIDEVNIKLVAQSNSVCVLLPGVSYFLNYDFAPARKLINSNAIVALSTDYNPGSCNISNLSFIMSLAAIKMKMTFEEVISAFTINAAAALMLNNKVGSIEIGKSADLSILDMQDYSELIYNVGENLNYMTIKRGEIIYKSNIKKSFP